MAGILKLTQEKLEKRINHYIAVSPYIEEYLIQLGVPKKQITVIPNAVKPRTQISNTANEVIFSGRLEVSKGAKLILDLWRVNRNLPAINIIGNGDLLEDFKNASFKDKRILVHGALSQIELEKVASNCSVALVPSLTAESFGRSAVEALARGQSLVTTRIGALKSLATEGVAVGFNEASLDDFNRAVEEALGSHSLPSSAKFIEFWNLRFSPTQISKDWVNFYSQRSQERG
jgi:glycosyltransferase involved in cell wall biosynthesis